MNDLVFIRDTIKQLKSEYGSPLIVIETTTTNNLETGIPNVTTREYKINRAIRLPNQISFSFLKTLNAVKLGGTKVGEFFILIDKEDVPKDFRIDYAEFMQRRLDIVDTEDFEYALILNVKQVSGAARVGIRKRLNDVLSFVESL